ncbi:uncharacterized protein LACBIDRAFT_326715 [Laccaria bicolor S238N-H82]|uniref:Predicted protein n=1 Tax=Laccaria bicolor (strain S238N-H82 / ATCC MYA-4686) TaxID=486041 RepID=B0D9F8_LACBS|nr:uncharacterized protein LACBIDRAFT_326715 [Laccaria bicolor S238N-H82]EDR08573.1 predicted protein [Laccaria bicolor S238N-H82]|eukprot:XP_001880798.1 predicted protein [Laccaria bicolor S238N-H82]
MCLKTSLVCLWFCISFLCHSSVITSLSHPATHSCIINWTLFGLLAMVSTSPTSKPYYKEYTHEGDHEFCTTDAYCWNVLDRQVRMREVMSEAGINTFIEHPDKGDPPSWWVITTPNAGYILTAPIGIRHIQAKVDGHFGLDDRTLHPQMYIKSSEYICCIPICDQSRHMLWWTPNPEDCPIIPNSPFSVTIHVLKPELLNGYKDLCNKYVGLIGKCEGRDCSPLAGLLVTAMCQALNRLRSFGMTYKEILLAIAEFQRAVLDIHAWINFVDVYQPRLFPSPNGVVKYEANQKLMGAFTEKVQVAQQLQAMGIPVWLIRPSFHILPTMNVNFSTPQLHCDKIVLHHFKDGQGNLDPYPVLATGPPLTELYRWTQCIGCAIMDLQDVTAIDRQDFIKGNASIGGVRDAYSIPVPSAPALSSAGKVGPSAYLLPSSGSQQPSSSSKGGARYSNLSMGQQTSSSSKVLLSVASQQLSQHPSVPSIQPAMPNPTHHGGPGPSKRPHIAEANVADVDSPFMPVPILTWANTLCNLDTNCRHLRCQPGDVGIGYKYPKPDIFLNSKNRALYTTTWLAVWAHHAYMLATGTKLLPPITAQQWRNFLMRIIPFPDADDIDHAVDLDDTTSVSLPPQPVMKGKQRKLGTTQELEQALTPEVMQEIL